MVRELCDEEAVGVGEHGGFGSGTSERPCSCTEDSLHGLKFLVAASATNGCFGCSHQFGQADELGHHRVGMEDR